ncbi:nuclear transport factor 2 family protein [Coralloluteibacterium thermophilus]|uniref:Nuclear transport factor 2 family protein n=1 Tax=Coralloluteibacterium thermophilum TaxID=2707049 RepID=A0ABV9NF70_9GAMM
MPPTHDIDIAASTRTDALRRRLLRIAGAQRALLLPVAAALAAPVQASQSETSAALVTEAFAAWKAGRGGIFELLAEDAVWTVAGSSPVSGTWHGREPFLRDVVAPINARLATPIVPEVVAIVADGTRVVVHWDGHATARDGRTYTNSYAWFLTVADGRITHVTAFLDTWALEALMQRDMDVPGLDAPAVPPAD